jgi:hypothetical protein
MRSNVALVPALLTIITRHIVSEQTPLAKAIGISRDFSIFLNHLPKIAQITIRVIYHGLRTPNHLITGVHSGNVLTMAEN